MNNITDGFIRITDDLTIFPGFSFQQFKKTSLYTNQDEIKIIYLDGQQVIGKRKYIVGLFFRYHKIYIISLICCDKEFRETDEKKRKTVHDEILKEWGIKEQKNFNWGKISSDYDARSNISSINIEYF